jgi:hypothetical protein
MRKGPYPEDDERYLKAAREAAEERRMQKMLLGLKSERIRREHTRSRHLAALRRAERILNEGAPDTKERRRLVVQRARKILGE